MKTITTANLNIDPELCKRMDRVIYSTIQATPENVAARADVFRAELLDLIAAYNQDCAKHEATAPLYRLCCVADRLMVDWGKHNSERGHANMHTATNQLKNWR